MVLSLVGRKTVALLTEPNLRILSLRCSVISPVAVFMCWLRCFFPFSLSLTESWKSKSCLKTRDSLVCLCENLDLSIHENPSGGANVSRRARRFVKVGGKDKFAEQQGGRLHLHSLSYCVKIYRLLIWPRSHLRGYCGNRAISAA